MGVNHPKSLRKTLIHRGIISTALPIFFLGILSIVISGATLYRAINERNYTIVRQGALQVEKHIATLEKDIRLLATEIEVGGEHELHLRHFIKNHPEYSAAWITDEKGTVLFAAPGEFSLVGMDKSRSEAFQATIANGNTPHFSSTTISYELQEPVVTISYPLEKGVIALEYKTAELNRYMAHVTHDQSFYLVLSDNKGTWITHPDSTKVRQRERDPNTSYLKRVSSSNRDSLWLRFEGKMASYFVKENSQAGWMITIYQPLSVIFSPLLLLMALLLIIGLLLLTLSIIQTWRTVNRTIKPIEDFVSVTEAVSNGDYALTLPEVSFTEMETLKRALQTMVVSIEEREEKQRELWEQLVQSQKMEVVGVLAGGIAHDFNNILTAIGGFAELLQSDLPEGSRDELYASEICNSVTRASALTRQLLTFSRKEDVHTTEVEVVSCVESMMHMLNRIVGEDIHLTLQSSINKASIRVDLHHLEQVLLNLTVNAADALREQQRDEPAIVICIGKDENHAVLTVEDNGGGIPDSVIEHIFEPFFTTKEIGKGTGMGLSTVKGIIEQHGADITIQTSSDGTIVTTRWPLYTSEEETQAPTDTVHEITPLQILFTDDEPMLRTIGATMIESLGHSVTTASNGKEALRILEEKEGDFDMLLTDLIMPGGMSGDMLAEKVQTQWPSIQILFLSGYTDNHLENAGIQQDENVHFLPKPFRIDQLKKALEKRYWDRST